MADINETRDAAYNAVNKNKTGFSNGLMTLKSTVDRQSFNLGYDAGHSDATAEMAERVRELLEWVDIQISSIHRSSLVEASRGALNAFYLTREKLQAALGEKNEQKR